MVTDAQKWLIFAGILFVGWLLYLLAPVLTPFLLGLLLAYLGDPLVDRLESVRISRTISVVIVFACMIMAGLILLLFLVPLIEKQLFSFIRMFPEILEWVQATLIPGISERFGIELGAIDLDSVKKTVMSNWKGLGNVIGRIFARITESGQLLLGFLTYLILVPVVTFYLLRDWDLLVERIHELIPRSYEKLVSRLSRECDGVLSEFLRGQLLVMLGQGIIYTTGLWIVGLEFALLIGMLAGIVSFVPYLGFVVGFSVAAIAALVQFNDLVHLIYIGVVFGIGQAIEGMILSPLLVGDRIGLHPVAVIFAVMAGGQLFGFFGVLLALPAAAVIVVLLRHTREQYLNSNLYSP